MIKAKPIKKKITKVIPFEEVLKRELTRIPAVPDDVRKIKILIPCEEVLKTAWMKSIPVPLTKGEKCIVKKEQDCAPGYVRVIHGPAGDRVDGVFNIDHFTKPDGSKIWWRPKKDYIRTFLIMMGKIKINPDFKNDKRFMVDMIVPVVRVGEGHNKRTRHDKL